jgi:hypothetical protein
MMYPGLLAWWIRLDLRVAQLRGAAVRRRFRRFPHKIPLPTQIMLQAAESCRPTASSCWPRSAGAVVLRGYIRTSAGRLVGRLPPEDPVLGETCARPNLALRPRHSHPRWQFMPLVQSIHIAQATWATA